MLSLDSDMRALRATLVTALCLTLWLSSVSPAFATQVEVQALMGKTVVLMIDGERQTMRVGQSVGGVKLLAATAHNATLEINGRRRNLGLSSRIHTRYEKPSERTISIPRTPNNQYLTSATVNGRSLQVLVDTGANVVAMSAAQADALGIDYFSGRPSRVETASGLVEARQVTLGSVIVGGIEVNNVEGSVVLGNYPVVALLGMSYLRHVKMQEHNGILSLTQVK